MNKKDLVYANLSAAEGNEVPVFLYGEIAAGSEYGDGLVNAMQLISELYYLNREGYQPVVKINTVGGNVFGGYQIMDAIRETGADCQVVGMAASMGAAILQAGRKRKMNDYASIMIHSPSGSKQTENEVVDMVRGQLKNIMKARTKFAPETIEEMMNSGKDYWFAVGSDVENERNALNLGLVDEVIETSVNVKHQILAQKNDASKLWAIYNSILTPNGEKKTEAENKKNKKIMENLLIKAALGLQPEANDSQVLNAYNAVLTEKDAEIERLNAEVKNFADKEIDGFIAEAKSKNYPEAGIDALRAIAKANIENAKSVLSSFEATASASDKGGKKTFASVGNSTKPTEGGLKSYKEYMATAKGEAEFYALSQEEQNEVLNKK